MRVTRRDAVMMAGAALASASWYPILASVYPPPECLSDRCRAASLVVTVPFLIFPLVLGALLGGSEQQGGSRSWRAIKAVGAIATAGSATAGLVVYESFVDPPVDPANLSENVALLVLGWTVGVFLAYGLVGGGSRLARRFPRARAMPMASSLADY